MADPIALVIPLFFVLIATAIASAGARKRGGRVYRFGVLALRATGVLLR